MAHTRFPEGGLVRERVQVGGWLWIPHHWAHPSASPQTRGRLLKAGTSGRPLPFGSGAAPISGHSSTGRVDMISGEGWQDGAPPLWSNRSSAVPVVSSASLPSEWLPPLGYKSLAAARADIKDYFMRYYNWRRPHSANEGLPPGAAENQLNLVSKIG